MRLVMGSQDEIGSLVDELRLKEIRGKDRINNYLIEKQVPLDKQIKFYMKLQDDYDNDYTFTVSSWINENIKILVDTDPLGLLSILESRTRKGPDYLTSVLLNLQDVEVEKLIKLYAIVKDMQSNESKIISGYLLGEIGIRNAEFLSKEIREIPIDVDIEESISYLMALRIASNRFRNPNFVLTDDAIRLIIKCAESKNEKLSLDAVFSCVVLFEFDSRFRNLIHEYFSESEEQRISVYKWLDMNDLSDQNFEFSLLEKSPDSKSSEEIKTVMWVLGTKIFRTRHPTNRFLDKDRWNLFCLKFIHKLFTRTDIQLQQFLSRSLFTDIGDLNIKNASLYLTNWISNETIDPVKHQFIYPTIIYEIFKNHEEELIEFLSSLSVAKQSFEMLIAHVIAQMIFDLKLNFGRDFTVHNETIVRDLKRVIQDPDLQVKIETLPANHLDDLDSKMSEAIKIIDWYKINNTNANPGLEHIRKDLQAKIDYIQRKKRLLNRSEALLIEICKRLQISHERLTSQHMGKKIRDRMKRCEILRCELPKKVREEIKYEDIKNRLSSFPNIEKYLDYRWLEDECKKNYPYHHIITWLSKTIESHEFKKLILDFNKEKEPYIRESKSRKIRSIVWVLAWLNHVEKCLGYFIKGTEQGKKTIIEGLKDDSNFFQFLTQLEIGLRLRNGGYKVDLEVKSDSKLIDIVATKDSKEIIFELATLDMYAELKYSGFAGDVPDRARSKVLEKTIGQISTYSLSHSGPTFIVLNLTHAHDVDLFGVTYVLEGSDIDTFTFEKGKIVNRGTAFRRDQEFQNLEEGKKLSGVIYCRNEFDGTEIKLTGDIIFNQTADVKMDGKETLELKKILFD